MQSDAGDSGQRRGLAAAWGALVLSYAGAALVELSGGPGFGLDPVELLLAAALVVALTVATVRSLSED